MRKNLFGVSMNGNSYAIHGNVKIL